MLTLSNLKRFYKLPERTTDDFIKIHRYVEGYWKRVYLIGLRLNGIQYANARTIIENTYIKGNKDTLNKITGLILDNRSISRHKEFCKLKELFLAFTSIYRNKVVHGLADDLNKELIKFLCHTDKSFVEEFEKILKKEFKDKARGESTGISALDKPTKFGALKRKDEELKSTVTRLNLGTLSGKSMAFDEAKKMLDSTSYKL